jgi:acetyl-CoA carboxylase biotin carboxyl carrier protein
LFDIEKIRQLVDMMIANDLAEISLRNGDVEVNLRRPVAGGGDTTPIHTAVPIVTAQAPAANPATGADPSASAPTVPEAKDEETDVDLAEIKSPMVGTFYVAPDPDSPPYVQVGSPVHPDAPVCIIEAMKVFNEIKAEVTGSIEKILVANEQPVEYGQPLFLVRPE